MSALAISDALAIVGGIGSTGSTTQTRLALALPSVTSSVLISLQLRPMPKYLRVQLDVARACSTGWRDRPLVQADVGASNNMPFAHTLTSWLM